MDGIKILLTALLLLSLASTGAAATGLVGEWHFDGDAKDSSGNGNDGTISGATFVTGISGQALTFDGVDDYVEVPGTNLAPPMITLEVWFKADSTDAPTNILNKAPCGATTTPNYKLEFGASSNIIAYIWKEGGGNTNYITIQTPIDIGKWYQITFVANYTNIFLYKNGALVDSIPFNANIQSTSQKLYFGGDPAGYCEPRRFDGLIDEVRIYNRALSASEIQANYNTLMPTPTPTITQTLTPTPTPAPTAGSISVSSSPSGASIYLDGSYQGKTPKTVADVSTGSHYIELKLDGYKPWSDSVDVVAESTSYVSAPLVLLTPITTTKTPIPTSTESSVTQTPTSTKTTATLIEPPIPTSKSSTPSESKTNWTLLGGVILAILLIGIVALRMRKPKERTTKAIEEPESKDKPLQKDINITSAFGYKGATILYKVKVENTIAAPIADIKVSLFVPNVFLLLEKEKSFALLKPGESKTVTFEIRPTGECGDCEVSGKVTYYDTAANKTKEIDIDSKMLSIVCPMLKVKEISEAEWHSIVSSLIETEESTKEIEMPAETLFAMTSRIIKDMHMHMLKPEVAQSQQLFNGVARFYGEGVKDLRYGAQVEVVGGARKSKLILKAWAEKEDALTGFYHGILDKIEKRINVKGYIDEPIVQHFNIAGHYVTGQVGKIIDVGDKSVQDRKE